MLTWVVMIVNRRNLFRIWSDYAGVTLLEVLVALVLLGLLAGSMLHISGVAGRWTEEASRQNQAAALAFGILEYCWPYPIGWKTVHTAVMMPQLWSSDPVNRALYPWQQMWSLAMGSTIVAGSVRVNWDGDRGKAVEMCTLLYRPRRSGQVCSQLVSRWWKPSWPYFYSAHRTQCHGCVLVFLPDNTADATAGRAANSVRRARQYLSLIWPTNLCR